VSVDTQAKVVSFDDGTQIAYEHLISSMPMDNLLRAARNLPGYTPEQLSAKASQFRYSSSHIVGIGMEGQPPAELRTKCWFVHTSHMRTLGAWASWELGWMRRVDSRLSAVYSPSVACAPL